jgi:hypothetical protein
MGMGMGILLVLLVFDLSLVFASRKPSDGSDAGLAASGLVAAAAERPAGGPAEPA